MSEVARTAVIMAAGLGSRLRPVTYHTPKPLIEINGKMIIETIIDALYSQGIEDIYIIRGYLSGQFDILLEKYPYLHMLNNLTYDKGNNILSACLAGNLISNAFVMPADIWINNSDVFSRQQDHSNVLGYRIEKTEDWCIETDEEGKIIRLSPGGSNCFKDTGIFYWSSKDGIKLSEFINDICSDTKNWNRYWSSVPFVSHKEHFNSFIRECSPEDVIEIDTLEELMALDSSYEQYRTR